MGWNSIVGKIEKKIGAIRVSGHEKGIWINEKKTLHINLTKYFTSVF